MSASPALASTVSKFGATIFYTAQVNEGNNVTVVLSGSNYVFTEAVDGTPVTIQNGGGCFSDGSNTATCPASGVTRITVSLRNLDDTANLGAIAIAVTLNGEDGNDVLTAGSGADTLDGGNHNDTLNGNAGNDTFLSNAGNDAVAGGAGDDVFQMGSAADGADVFTGDAGTDTADYSGRSAALALDVDDVADDGAAGEADNLRHFSTGLITPPNTIENLRGGSAGDSIRGSTCPNIIQGGGGNDVLNGGPESGSCGGAAFGPDNDTLEGGDGNDTLNGLGGNDVLRGGPGADVFNGGTHGSLIGASGDVADYSLESSATRSISIDGVANDGTVNASGSTTEGDNVGFDVEHINGGPGNDTLVGDGDANTLSGGAGNDVLDGGLGADELNGGAGSDTASYASRSSAVTADNDGVADDGASGEGDNVATDVEGITGGSGADSLTGGAGADILLGGAGIDTLNGLGGNDLLQGGDGTDTLNGGDGDDQLGNASGETGAGNDTLNGGAGNDTLDGLFGADTVNAGPGDDVIRNLPDGSNDKLFGNEGVDTIVFWRNSSCFGGPPCAHLSVTLDDSANDGTGGGGDNVHSDIENVTITDLVGGYGNDTIVGDADANVLDAGRGDDTVTGGSGNDTLIADEGGDTLNGGLGADLLLGGDGADTLNGGDGNDTLDGGAGGDVVSGGGGLGDLADYSARTNPVTVRFNGSADDGEAGEGDNLSRDVEQVNGGSGNDTIVGGIAIGIISFAADNVFRGGGGADTLNGADGNDQLFGGAGNDTLLGGKGVDILGGDAGDDTLDGGTQLDVIDGGNGNGDTVDYSSRSAALNVNLSASGGDGQAGENDDVTGTVENIRGGSGADTLTGHGGANRLEGGAGNDVLNGLAGNDTLDGGTGADTFNGGDGADTADYSSRSAPVTADLLGTAGDGEAGENDRIGADVEAVRGGSGNDAFLGGSSADGPDRFTGGAGLDTMDYSARSQGLRVHKGGGQDGEAGEGDTVDFDIEVVKGGSGDDELVGTVVADVILGGPGSDTLSGEGGDDRLDGGPGGDAMNGGAGSDILDYSARTAPLKVTLGDGLANDGEAGEGDNAGADFDVVLGGSSNDRLTGSSIQNILRGEDGNDVLDGAGGNDTLVGGPGDDRLLGGPGGVGVDNDDLVGEAGNDTADYSARSETLTIDLDDDDDDGGPGEGDNVWASTENVVGGSGGDTITGNASPNRLRGGAGADTLNGLGGDDWLHSRDGGPDVVDCGDGNDTAAADPDATDTLAGCEDEQKATFAPPVNTVAPEIQGTTRLGEILTAVAGTWQNDPELTFQWLRCTGETCLEIDWAIGETYLVVLADVGRTLKLAVAGENEDGVASAASAASDEIVMSSAEISLQKSATPTVAPLRGLVTYTVTVANAGPDDAVNVTVTDDLPSNVTFVSASPGCTGTGPVTCSIASIPVGESVQLQIVVRTNSAGSLTNTASATTAQQEGVTTDNTDTVQSSVSRCTILGTRGPDRLVGTRRSDVICGLGGKDKLLGKGGKDTLLGGPGNDTLDGGKGRDVLKGAGGRDTLLARDGVRDVVDGGKRRDRARVDPRLDRLRSIEVLL